MPAALAATAGSSFTTSPGACTSSASTVWTRLIKLRFLAGSTSSGTSACGGLTTSPVHSRNPPHEPQKASLSRFWNPHELQTIMLVRGPPA